MIDNNKNSKDPFKHKSNTQVNFYNNSHKPQNLKTLELVIDSMNNLLKTSNSPKIKSTKTFYKNTKDNKFYNDKILNQYEKNSIKNNQISKSSNQDDSVNNELIMEFIDNSQYNGNEFNQPAQKKQSTYETRLSKNNKFLSELKFVNQNDKKQIKNELNNVEISPIKNVNLNYNLINNNLFTKDNQKIDHKTKIDLNNKNSKNEKNIRDNLKESSNYTPIIKKEISFDNFNQFQIEKQNGSKSKLNNYKNNQQINNLITKNYSNKNIEKSLHKNKSKSIDINIDKQLESSVKIYDNNESLRLKSGYSNRSLLQNESKQSDKSFERKGIFENMYKTFCQNKNVSSILNISKE